MTCASFTRARRGHLLWFTIPTFSSVPTVEWRSQAWIHLSERTSKAIPLM